MAQRCNDRYNLYRINTRSHPTTFMLSDQQKAHFHALGFVIAPGVFTPEQINQYAHHFDSAMDQVQDDPSAAGHRIFPDGHRVIVPLIEADPYFYSLIDDPQIGGIADDLLGDDCIFTGISDGQIHSGNTNWHRDGGLPRPAIHTKFTFYLDPVTAGKGRLSVIPGSHLWPLSWKQLAKHIDDQPLGYPTADFPGRYDLDTRQGDLIVFSTRLWHASWGGGQSRRQIAWMMQTAISGQAQFDQLVRGYRIMADEWSPQTGRLVSDRFFESDNPIRKNKIRTLVEVDRATTAERS